MVREGFGMTTKEKMAGFLFLHFHFRISVKKINATEKSVNILLEK